MYFFLTWEDLGPVEVGTQGLDFPVLPQVGEGDAAPRSLQQCLEAVVAIQIQRLGQVSLIEHGYIRLLLADQLVQLPLLLL